MFTYHVLYTIYHILYTIYDTSSILESLCFVGPMYVALGSTIVAVVVEMKPLQSGSPRPRLGFLEDQPTALELLKQTRAGASALGVL